MSDDSDGSKQTEATPNRGRRREPPTIDAEPLAPGGQARPPARSAASGLLSLLPATAALLLATTALYYAVVDEPPEPPPAASPESVAALNQRLDKVEARVAALDSRPAIAAPPPVDLGPLEKRIAAAEAAAETARGEAARAAQRADSATRQSPVAQTVDLAPIEKRIASAEAAADAARQDATRALQRAETASQQPPAPPPVVDLKPLEDRIARLEAEQKETREALAAPKTELRATEAPNVPAPAANEAAALAVIASSLLQKIDKGAPLAREIAALEKIGTAPERIAALKAVANGAPTSARLSQEFSAQSAAMLRALRPAESEGDILDRVARSAASLVRVRPVGETAREDAPALVARIEAALQRGDIIEAVALHGRLPKEAQDMSRDWATRARQRADADVAIRQLIDNSIDRLAGK